MVSFLYYYLQTIDVSNIVRWIPPKLNQQNLRNIQIPVISKEEQEKIVNILDNFEKITSDLTEWLPAEIELRKKQYEYYRDKLLTFN